MKGNRLDEIIKVRMQLKELIHNKISSAKSEQLMEKAKDSYNSNSKINPSPGTNSALQLV